MPQIFKVVNKDAGKAIGVVEYMSFYDTALESLMLKIGYDKTKKMSIKIDDIAKKIMDISVKIVKEYNEPKYEGERTILFVFKYDSYSYVNTIDRNLMYLDLVGSDKPWDIKSREPWKVDRLGNYMFEGSERTNDYFGNYMYGVTGKEMFADMNFSLFGGNVGTDSYLINAAGLAQQWNDNGKVEGSFSWVWIRTSSGLSETGDNQGDVNMIKDGIERWYREYK